jgi:hypothetical protein
MIDRAHELPVSRQCQFLDIGRSSYYYQAVPVSQADVDLMRLPSEHGETVENHIFRNRVRPLSSVNFRLF